MTLDALYKLISREKIVEKPTSLLLYSVRKSLTFRAVLRIITH